MGELSGAAALKIVGLTVLTGLAGCDQSSQNRKTALSASSYTYHEPKNIADGWSVSSLNEQGIDPAPVVELVTKIRKNEYTGISSILLARHDKLVLDEYFGEGERDNIHSMRSASKALTGMLVGIAIDKNFIKNVDEKVLSYFPEYVGEIDNWDERKRDITVSHLLTMTSGVKGNEDAMYPTDDWIKFYLDQPLANNPGEAFSYATSGVVTLGNIITKASGLRVPAFTDRYLFGPLGITEYRWPYTSSRGDQHLAMTGGGLNLRPRDMLKLGQLYLNGGQWNGKQIVSKTWVDASTRVHATSDYKGEDYGYHWRMIDRVVNGLEIRSNEAWGNGGQFVMIFPSLDLVAVFTGENYAMFPEMEQPFEMIDKYILPAIR